MINIYTLPSFIDPDAHLYNQYHSDQWGSFNSCSFYEDEGVDELLDTARVIGDAAERQARYSEAQQIINAAQPAVWMYTLDNTMAYHNCVKGFRYSAMYPITVLFQDLWMKTARRSSLTRVGATYLVALSRRTRLMGDSQSRPYNPRIRTLIQVVCCPNGDLSHCL